MMPKHHACRLLRPSQRSGRKGYLFTAPTYHALRRFRVDFTGIMVLASADTSSRPPIPSDRWQAGDAQPLSLPRLAVGVLCIAAKLCCRPTFALTQYTCWAIALFWAADPRFMISDLAHRRITMLSVARRCHGDTCNWLWSSADVVEQSALRQSDRLRQRLPIHRLDMTRYATPIADMPATVWYTVPAGAICTKLPWLAVSRANAAVWGYEVMVGALFTATPLMLLALVLPSA